MARQFQTGMFKEYEDTKREKAHQDELKEKHNIQGENVIVVEKSNIGKFTVNMLIRLLKFIATVSLIALAIVGLAALLYPKPQADMIAIFTDIYNQVKTSLNL